MKRFTFILSVAMVLGLSTMSNAALINNGNGLIYDDDLNITWLQEPNNNRLTWEQAKEWASGLKNGGVDDGWRLPIVDPMEPYNRNTSEMGHLFYTELGNKADPEGHGLVNKDPFTNLAPSVYWTGTEGGYNSLGQLYIMGFDFSDGNQGALYLYKYNALAVHSGNIGAPVQTIAPVPIPAAMWLLGSGLVGLIGLKKKYLG